MFAGVYLFSIPSSSRVLMLLGQLERFNGETLNSEGEAIRQVTGKILHLIQTQGECECSGFSLTY